MRIIKVIDYRDYLDSWEKIERHAVRAIIRKDNLIALVKSNKEGFYKFPGGGIEEGEEHIDTLIRETEEETGLVIKENKVRDYGFFVECRRSIYEEAIFEQKSYYYCTEVEDTIKPIKLDQYEKELDYKLEWVDIHQAIKINKEFVGNEFSYIERETLVLKDIISNQNPKRVYLNY